MSEFIPGLELSRLFYHEAVRQALDAAFPGLPHSAALLGRGSEVLGFDDAMSTDHNWEARVLLFLCEEEHARHAEEIYKVLRERLPTRFRDTPTDFGVLTPRDFFRETLDFDIECEIEPADWLTFSEQRLRMVTAGAVHHDGIGLQAIRDRFAYYPHDVWLYLLASGWWRIHPEGNLLGRAGFVGDELGSALIGARIVRDLMRLCFLMERQYAPYAKWFGTAFARLPCSAGLSASLWRALQAETWPEREAALAVAYEYVAAMQNALQLTEPVAVEAKHLWNRPFKVVWGEFAGPLCAQIQDPEVKRIAEQWPHGSIDPLRDALYPPRSRRLLRRLFE